MFGSGLEADADEEDADGAYAVRMTHMIASVRCRIRAMMTKIAASELWLCWELSPSTESAESFWILDPERLRIEHTHSTDVHTCYS